MSLLLRADAERRWLQREVIPVLRELEARDRRTGQGAETALAYLEAMWSEAKHRAYAADAARGELRLAGHPDDHGIASAPNSHADDHAIASTPNSHPDDHRISSAADRYHAAVRVLRELLARRVNALIQGNVEDSPGYGEADGSLAEASAGGGCAPRAA